ncbi:alpha/beta-hydrolase [Dendrothele bispora CBS 962.96]|uniref:Carboxylic ester hydrolase n=1 Tax=Dendrothele bispora (strain CBS 962.96) TaxID=1314807 RepID=A0A4S8MNH1_DENBC|nr:alpha/beta-hydrolase [Dendrothele bispora CBS 962.96]
MVPKKLLWVFPALLSLAAPVLASLSVGHNFSPTVLLDYGILHGSRNRSTGIVSFYGVPFADPPVGGLRWKKPVFPPSKHLGIIDAAKFGKACISPDKYDAVTQSEDCLFLNVYMPAGTTFFEQLPVMVWIHGGGFQSGNTYTADPTLLLQSSASPMIFVSIEYRLGQFGFLAGDAVKNDGAINAGLLDQRAALQWVHRYIRHFGGDPNRVTIWGESAGAGSTMFQLMGYGGDTQGLFHAAMGDSPSLSFMPPYDGEYTKGIFSNFTDLAGCGSETETMKCLRRAESDTLIAAGTELLYNYNSTLYIFAPVFDGTFFQMRPVEAFQAGQIAKVPALFGCVLFLPIQGIFKVKFQSRSNTNEGATWSNSLRDSNANTSMPNATELTVYNFLQGQFASLTEVSFERALELYPLEDYNNSLILQGQQMYGEMRYICTALLVNSGIHGIGQPAYQYRYDNPIHGSNHAYDLQAMFPANLQAITDLEEDSKVLFAAMREYWTSFVTGGSPVSKSSSANWELSNNASNGSPRILLHPGMIGMEMIPDDLSERCAFWHELSSETMS